MKVKFRVSQKEHEVIESLGNYYILGSPITSWSSDCRIAVPKSAVDVVKEVTYHAGQRFMVGYGELRNEYILAQSTENEMVLISPREGNRWVNPIRVADYQHVTEAEMKTLAGTAKYSLVT